MQPNRRENCRARGRRSTGRSTEKRRLAETFGNHKDRSGKRYEQQIYLSVCLDYCTEHGRCPDLIENSGVVIG
ncbi:hypothetical protein SLA2020_007800 [Shorea laevis]